MALLVIDSKDNGFLKVLLDLVKKFKGAKAHLIDTDKSIEELEDAFLAGEIGKGVDSGFLTKEETNDFLDELRSVM
jgi:hypothetical protein